MSTYKGIDYGSITSANRNVETGIHYGVIGQNSINLDCTYDWEYDYGKPTCPTCGHEVKASDDETLFNLDCLCDPELGKHSEECEDAGESIESEDSEWFDGKDFACIDCHACYWSDQVYGDEAIGWSYEGEGYELCDCLDNAIFVLESPYFTFAQFCSPCVPGAGNLDNPLDPEELDHEPKELPMEHRTYCLGLEYFDEYNPCPYRVWRVADGTEVIK